jgi:hypothetical protein
MRCSEEGSGTLVTYSHLSLVLLVCLYRRWVLLLGVYSCPFGQSVTIGRLAQININRTYFTMRCSEEGSGTLEQENISDTSFQRPALFRLAFFFLPVITLPSEAWFLFSSLSPQININRTYFTMRCSEEGSGTLEQENISDMKACGESEEKRKCNPGNLNRASLAAP